MWAASEDVFCNFISTKHNLKSVHYLAISMSVKSSNKCCHKNAAVFAAFNL